MIEVKMDIVDGAKFYTIKLLEPDLKVNGVPIYLVAPELEVISAGELKRLGLQKIGRDEQTWDFMYAEPRYLLRFKISKVANKFYWEIIKWLYLNACMFRRKPAGQMFSWSSFTLYCWYRSIRAGLLSIRAGLYCWYRSIRASLLAKRGQRPKAPLDRNLDKR